MKLSLAPHSIRLEIHYEPETILIERVDKFVLSHALDNEEIQDKRILIKVLVEMHQLDLPILTVISMLT